MKPCFGAVIFTAKFMNLSRREEPKMNKKSIEKPARFDFKTLLQLFDYMKEYRFHLILVTICILLSAIASAASSS